MKITFLGTSASEEYPSVWCSCDNCNEARVRGGRNLRQNSAVIVDGDMIIDMGRCAFLQARNFGYDIRNVTTILVTHSHSDHFAPHLLFGRCMPEGYDKLSVEERLSRSAARFSPQVHLDMYGNASVERKLVRDLPYQLPDSNMTFHCVKPFEHHEKDGITIMTLDGNHPDDDIRSINYIVEKNGKTFLYLLDTGYPFENTLKIISQYKFDFVIVEGTFGLGIDSPAHMNLAKNIRLMEYFNLHQLWKGAPLYYITHVAPHWTPPYDLYAPETEKYGMTLAYDGMTIEI